MFVKKRAKMERHFISKERWEIVSLTLEKSSSVLPLPSPHTRQERQTGTCAQKTSGQQGLSFFIGHTGVMTVPASESGMGGGSVNARNLELFLAQERVQ